MNNVYGSSYRAAVVNTGVPNPYAEKNQQLLAMIRQDQLPRVKYLQKETFDPFLWGRLSLTKNSVYHEVTCRELTSGYLWAQEESDNCLSLQWITPMNSIKRATLTDGKIMLETFVLSSVDHTWNEKEITLEEFQKLIDAYFNFHPLRPGSQAERGLPALQRELELLPIVCKVTKAAREQLHGLSQVVVNPISPVIYLGVDGREFEYFNPGQNIGVRLANICDSFLYGAVNYLNGKAGNEDVEESVAPVVRSWKALDLVEPLRREELDDEANRINLGPLQKERVVRDLTSLKTDIYEQVANKACKDLRSWLVLKHQGGRIEYHEFYKCFGNQNAQENKLELNLDFQDGAWLLDSKFHSKV